MSSSLSFEASTKVAGGVAFADRLRAEGARRYHDSHPFHARMNKGSLSRADLRTWVVNRYYYETRIPIADALICAKSEDLSFRRAWRQRLVDHDGDDNVEGGLHKWVRLAGAVGVEPAALGGFAFVHPGVRLACDAHVETVRNASLIEAVAASLTECFVPELMKRRIDAWLRHYPWVDASALDYFRARVQRSTRNGAFALSFVVANARTPDLEEACVAALVKKAEILWHMLDCIDIATRAPSGDA
ncbi:MAG: pyrroloquinoline-quinone synthase PqqC [Polyangiaceae bacterium]|nr:pyrroloquinoline-quinone synthase PqqC [Polyangiaceae bacterium]